MEHPDMANEMKVMLLFPHPILRTLFMLLLLLDCSTKQNLYCKPSDGIQSNKQSNSRSVQQRNKIGIKQKRFCHLFRIGEKKKNLMLPF